MALGKTHRRTSINPANDPVLTALVHSAPMGAECNVLVKVSEVVPLGDCAQGLRRPTWQEPQRNVSQSDECRQDPATKIGKLLIEDRPVFQDRF